MAIGSHSDLEGLIDGEGTGEELEFTLSQSYSG
jgi:hypothetical protein